jgi:hypothetical protein
VSAICVWVEASMCMSLNVVVCIDCSRIDSVVNGTCSGP